MIYEAVEARSWRNSGQSINSRTVRREQEPSLRVKSRFGASVLHDGLWAWREEFGGQASPQSGPSQPVSNPTQLTPVHISRCTISAAPDNSQ
jgi:hypothetical protein